MTSDISANNGAFDSSCKAPAAADPALEYIARSAPLEQTLACIVQGVEERNPDISCAIFLLDRNGGSLRPGAAPGLAQAYCRAVGDIDMRAHMPMAERPVTEEFRREFDALALRHALQVCALLPIYSAQQRVLGVLAAYAKHDAGGGERHRQALAEVAALTSIAIVSDINESRLQQVEDALRESETRMALAIEGSGTGIWDRNVATGEIHYSAGWKAMLGYRDAEIGNRIEESYTRVHPDDLPYVQATIRAHFEQKTESYAVEHRIRCKDGSYKWISSRGKVVERDAAGQPLRMIGTTTDITTMRALSDRLQQSVDLITSLTNEIPGLVYQYRQLPSGAAFFSYVSEGIRDMYEIDPDPAADYAALIDAAIHPDDLAGYRGSLEAAAASLAPWHLEYRVVLPRQGLRWRTGNARPQRLPDGSTLWHGFVTDVTARKRIEIELQEFATTDFLTQLPNRRYFMERMEEELARVKSDPDTPAMVLMCDLDHFKMINDGYGHAIGDLVLRHFAGILHSQLRKSDTVGRVGGEEFAVILSGVDSADAQIFARRMQNQIAETPLIAGDKTISVTVSIGIARISPSDASADASLSRSDMALYRAKERGRNRIEMAAE
jgi:diguanylate cyclase (GGDEF)-like protein/PAS domain S-box-containing protein